MINAIIIEDEHLVAKGLLKLLQGVAPEVHVIQLLDSLKDSLVYFKSNPEPDLLFMDIQLNDGVSFELLKEIKLDCPIIFTTSYNEYAIRAFKLNSIDYLLKPVDSNELKSAIEKYKRLRYMGDQTFKEQFKSLLGHLNLPEESKVYKQRFSVHSGKSFLIVDQKNIACFEKDVLIYLVTKDKQKFITDFQTMEEIEELMDPLLFFRANRQTIIRSTAVESFRTDSYGKLAVKLKTPVNTIVDISRQKAQAFKKWIQ